MDHLFARPWRLCAFAVSFLISVKSRTSSQDCYNAAAPRRASRMAESIETGSSDQLVREDELVALRAIVEGTAGAHGAGFFQSLVQHLAEALQAGYAMIAEFAGDGRA